MTLQLYLLLIGFFFLGMFTLTIFIRISNHFKVKRCKNCELTFPKIKEKWTSEWVHIHEPLCRDCYKEVLWLIKEIERYQKIMDRIYSNGITLVYKKDIKK